MQTVRDFRAILAYEEDARSRWNALEDLETGVFIAYRFATGSEVTQFENGGTRTNPYNGDFRVYTEKEKAAFREAVKVFEAVSGVRMIETTSKSAELVAYNADLNASNPAGYAGVPFIQEGSGSFDDPIDSVLSVVLNMEADEQTTDSGFRILLHEIAHTLGLSHPFDGAFVLPDELDNTDTTVMSYTHTPVTGRTLSPMDVEALQHIYGKSSVMKGWDYEIKNGALNAKGSGADQSVVGLLHFKNNIKGLGGDDLIVGWEKDDKLEGGNGKDVLKGSYGNDKLYGGNGNDRLEGARGDDTLKGGNGNDRLFGDPDSDFTQDFGDDVLDGGKGNDILHGRNGNDVLKGGGGNDKLYGDTTDTNYSGNDDVLRGGAGKDKAWGGFGNDTVKGDAGNDKLWGDAGNDMVYGGDGKDVIKGGAGRDMLFGGKGADKLTGDDSGRAEADVFVFTRQDRGARDKITDFNLRIDTLDISASGFDADDMKVAKVAGNALLKFGGAKGIEIVLQGITKPEVQALSDFDLFA